MGRLLFGLAGAALGSFTGLGANTGYLIGSSIGGFLFPDPPVVVEGPRLGDLSISASTYGQAISIGYGTLRMGGNLIWSSGLREERNEEEVTGGKGSAPTQVNVTYTYFADIAYAFAEGEADDALRIWFDNKVVHDKRGQASTSIDGLSFIFYPGDEEQLPDPTIEAIEGVGNVPGHRGLVYILFKNLNVTEYGNRVPQCTAEIAFSSITADSGRLVTENNTISTGHDLSELVHDSRRRLAYMVGSSGLALRVMDMNTMVEIREQSLDDLISEPLATFEDLSVYAVDSEGFIYGAHVLTSSNRPIVKIDPNSLIEVDRFGDDGGGGSPDKFASLVNAMIIEGLNPTPDPTTGIPGRSIFFVGGTILGPVGVLNAKFMSWLHYDNNASFVEIQGMAPVPAELAPLGHAKGYWISQNGGNNSARLYSITIAVGAGGLPGGGTWGVEIDLVDTIPASTWFSNGSTFEISGPVYDPADGGLIFMKDSATANENYVFKWIPEVGLQWITVALGGGIVRQKYWPKSVITDNKLGWVSDAEEASLIDTTDGTIIVDRTDMDPITPGGSNAGGEQFYDGETQSIFAVQSDTTKTFAQYFLGRVTGQGELLSAIVTDLSNRVGLLGSDLDVSELTDVVRGYGVTRQMPARAAVEPLSTAFFFDGVESDDQMEFKKRGRDSVRTITEAGMMVVTDNTHDVIAETRVQEVELPQRISVTYMDIDTDYQQGVQSVRRILNPSPTMRSRNEQTVQVPIVFSSTEAEQIAERLLFTAWNERTSYQFMLPWDHLDLDAADVIDLSITRDAVTTLIRARIIKAVTNLDLSMSIDALNEDKLTLISDAVADGGQGVPVQEIPLAAFTELWVFDIPLLRDIDFGGTVSATLYFAMDGLRDGWPGGVLYQGDNALSFTNTGHKSTLPVTHGTVMSLIPDTSTPFLTDDATIINVYLNEGALSSITEDEFLNDNQVGLFGSVSTGQYEIINFKNATLQANGSYNLQRIMRGRRGTDAWTGTHAIGEKFFLLGIPQVTRMYEELGDLNAPIFYKGVGFGTQPESADTLSENNQGVSLYPYAPKQVDAVVDGSDNIDLSWIRRDKVNGELRSGSGVVPLSEDTESYAIDIKDGPGGTVVRTVTGLTSPAYEYTKANLITDIGIGTGTTTLDVASAFKFGRASGSFITDGFVVGQTIETSGFTDGANNGIFTIVDVSATLLEVSVSTLVVESGGGDENIDVMRGTTLTFTPIQISAQIGRGFETEVTITL